MKQGGRSYGRIKSGVKSRLSCPICKRMYKMDWALENHKKLCEERSKAKGKGNDNEFIK